MSKSHKNVNRLLAMILSVAMVMTLTPVSVFAAEKKAAPDIEVTLTVADKGEFAKAADGTLMAERAVTVKDLDGDGVHTYHEALVAAHKAYNTEAGYRLEDGDWGKFVAALWGTEYGAYLFYQNEAAPPVGVDQVEVKAGDRLYTAILKDGVAFTDIFSYFDAPAKTAVKGKNITLNLSGIISFAETKLDGMQVGLLKDGVFEPLEGKVTDKDGNVTLSFEKSGTYTVTAKGTKKVTGQDWSSGSPVDVEIDAVLMPPLCTVTVEPVSADVIFTVNDKGSFAEDKDGKSMINRPVKAVDLNDDGTITYDEALTAVHETYLEKDKFIMAEGKWGKYVQRLWGVDYGAYLFYQNGLSPAVGVDQIEVKAGDRLYTSILKDGIAFTDIFSTFDAEAKSVDKNEDFMLNLKGIVNLQEENLKGMKIGVWENGTFKQIDKKVTDKSGNVFLSFDKEGTYIVTAQGTKKVTGQDWSSGSPVDVEVDAVLMPPVCVVTVSSSAVEINKQVKNVEDMIDAIGKVTKDSGAAIRGARNAYVMLPHDMKLMVKNIDVLESAEAEYAKLTAPEKPEAVTKSAREMYKATADRFYKNASFGYGDEWALLGLLRGGYNVDKKAVERYYQSVLQILKANNGKLPTREYADYSKTIIALTAAGYNPEDIGGYNMLEQISDMKNVTMQGLNGTIWALIAIKGGNYQMPSDATATEETLVNAILKSELKDGGFAYTGKKADVDMTAMALQALAPYYDSREDVKAAVNRGLKWLSGVQNKDGSFNEIFGSECAESTAQVIVALTALGIDVDKDARFMNNDKTVIDGLAAFYLDEGQFAHINNNKANGIASVQALYSLASYLRFAEGKTSLYDMTDVRSAANPAAKDTILPVPGPKGTASVTTDKAVAKVEPAELKAVTNDLTVNLGDKKVVYDKKALASINKQIPTDAQLVEFVLEKTDKGVNDKQAKTIKDSKALGVFSVAVNVTKADGTVVQIHNFDGGKAVITVPFANPENLKLEVYRVNDDGSVKLMNTTYENGMLTWVTDGHSYYMVAEAGTVTAEGAPKTGDTSTMLPWMILLMGAAAVMPVVRKRYTK